MFDDSLTADCPYCGTRNWLSFSAAAAGFVCKGCAYPFSTKDVRRIDVEWHEERMKKLKMMLKGLDLNGLSSVQEISKLVCSIRRTCDDAAFPAPAEVSAGILKKFIKLRKGIELAEQLRGKADRLDDVTQVLLRIEKMLPIDLYCADESVTEGLSPFVEEFPFVETLTELMRQKARGRVIGDLRDWDEQLTKALDRMSTEDSQSDFDRTKKTACRVLELAEKHLVRVEARFQNNEDTDGEVAGLCARLREKIARSPEEISHCEKVLRGKCAMRDLDKKMSKLMALREQLRVVNRMKEFDTLYRVTKDMCEKTECFLSWIELSRSEEIEISEMDRNVLQEMRQRITATAATVDQWAGRVEIYKAMCESASLTMDRLLSNPGSFKEVVLSGEDHVFLKFVARYLKSLKKVLKTLPEGLAAENVLRLEQDLCSVKKELGFQLADLERFQEEAKRYLSSGIWGRAWPPIRLLTVDWPCGRQWIGKIRKKAWKDIFSLKWGRKE